MLLKIFIHQECHVIEYGIKKLQMGSNLEAHKKKKTKMCNKAKQKLCHCNYIELHYCSKKEGEICNEHIYNIQEKIPPFTQSNSPYQNFIIMSLLHNTHLTIFAKQYKFFSPSNLIGFSTNLIYLIVDLK
jgi:hypothetical protein